MPCLDREHRVPLFVATVAGGWLIWLQDVAAWLERKPASEVQLLRCSGQLLLDESALDAVRRCRLVAARRCVQSLACWVESPVRCSVRDPEQRAALPATQEASTCRPVESLLQVLVDVVVVS